MLLITREFEKQVTALQARDFEAALTVVRALDAFLYFNCGYNSGASQPHKHMQLIPLANMNQEGVLPIEEAAIKSGNFKAGATFKLHQLEPMRHVFYGLDGANLDGEILGRAYHECLAQLGIAPENPEDEVENHSFWLTQRMMFVVVRACPGFPHPDDKSINLEFNTTAYTGNFGCRNE